MALRNSFAELVVTMATRVGSRSSCCARSIVWLGLKVCLLVIVGVALLWLTAAILVIALVAATR